MKSFDPTSGARARMIGWGATILVALGAVSASCMKPNDDGRATATADGTAASSIVYRVPTDGAPTVGDPRAPVTIVSFSDYECPFCQRGDVIVAQLRKAYGAKVRVVFRQKPLPIHPHAHAAATAALAANEQGKFQAMHALLFANSRSLDEESLARFATEAGLDPVLWRADRTRVEARLAADGALADTLGVGGTPTFFINGRRIAGAQPLDTFRPIIDEEIAKAEGLVAKGVRPEDVYATLMKDAVEKGPPVAKIAAKTPPAGAAAPAPEGKADCDKPDGDCGCTAHDDPPESSVVEEIDVGAAPVKGGASAAVTVVVFSDFECPFCRRSEATLRTLSEQYGSRLRIVWKNDALPMHASARIAAKASLAAAEQGKFWEYHDVLFTHQDALDPASLEQYAADLGLDVARFRAAIADARTDASLRADEAQAARLGVTGTPTFFINGRRLAGAQPLAKFQEKVELALAERAR